MRRVAKISRMHSSVQRAWAKHGACNVAGECKQEPMIMIFYRGGKSNDFRIACEEHGKAVSAETEIEIEDQGA